MKYSRHGGFLATEGRTLQARSLDACTYFSFHFRSSRPTTLNLPSYLYSPTLSQHILTHPATVPLPNPLLPSTLQELLRTLPSFYKTKNETRKIEKRTRKNPTPPSPASQLPPEKLIKKRQDKQMLYPAETPRLYLERLSLKHLPDFHELWNNDEAVLWSYVPFPLFLPSTPSQIHF